MKAFAQNENEKAASVKEISVPKLEENDILIKVSYAAQNPTDWKHSAFLSPPNAILGCDLSGTVVAIGSSPKNTSIKVGDKVAGCVHGGLFEDKGSYAEYARAESDLIFKVPEGQKMEEMAVFGVPWVTACQAMISSQGKSWPPAKVSGNPWYLIYGASSSVGLFALQLAKIMGYRPIAICSPHNFDLVKSYGAEATVDYHDGEKASEEVKRISGGGVELGLDTISEKDSFKIAIGGFGEKGGQLNSILPPSDEAKKIRSDVKVVNTLMYTLFGHEFKFGPNKIPASESDRAFGVEVNQRTPELIKKYGIKSNPIVIKGGMETIKDGFEEMKAGKVSGKKLVYKIQ